MATRIAVLVYGNSRCMASSNSIASPVIALRHLLWLMAGLALVVAQHIERHRRNVAADHIQVFVQVGVRQQY